VSTIGDWYAEAAEGWVRGASLVYGPLAELLVDRCPIPLAGERVLDLGAGTGVATDAIVGRGGHPFALDRSLAMLAWQQEQRPPAAVADAMALPVRTDAVAASVAAFVLNHLTAPVVAMSELARVTRRGGAVLVSAYATSSSSPSRDRVDAIAVSEGFEAPDWYRHIKTAAVPLLGDARAMGGAATTAGLVEVDTEERRVDVGIHRAADLVDYRFGQAHYAGWLATLAPARRAVVRQRAIEAVEPIMEPFLPTIVLLVARVH
jgi:ubiquinone/menaquinone biosynthesis C-methylase UbiE